MEMIEQMRNVLKFLEGEPRALKADANKKAFEAFTRALANIHTIVQSEVRARNPDYQALRQALGTAAHQMDKSWFVEKKKEFGVKGGKNKDEMQLLAAAAFGAGKAKSLLAELRKTPEMRYQDELVSLAQMDPQKALEGVLKKYKGESLQAFCKANGVTVAVKQSRSGKSTIDSANTKAALLARIVKLHARI